MEKKVKIINIRKPRTDLQLETQDQTTSDIADLTTPISKEVVRKKPVNLSNKGFTAFIRKIIPTREGFVSHIEEPMVISKSGHIVKENGILGQCHICGGYDSYLYNCQMPGCKRSLCLQHAYFFKDRESGKDMPYCLEHYRVMVDNFDTWQAYKDGLKQKHER